MPAGVARVFAQYATDYMYLFVFLREPHHYLCRVRPYCSKPLSFALGVGLVASTHSPKSVGSDLSFLFQNDLNWPTAQDHNGTILVSKPGTNVQAIASCEQLSETLLPTNGTYFKADMSYLLRYLAFETFDPAQKYWLRFGFFDRVLCNFLGGISPVGCVEELPAFCSQSAPYRPNTETDMNTQYHVASVVGESHRPGLFIVVSSTRDHLSFRFIGIPYADPFERWTYSKVYSSAGNVTALTYGASCTQIGYGSENCLYLNIQTPYLPHDASTSKGLKPVMFSIYGGAFTSGEGSLGIYDVGNLASRSDVVVITMNYRLSTISFLALEDGVTNGNYGIADQITALRWVQEHIADFGGDPSRVTIVGQSSGAASVRALLAAKPAFGLFAGAIAQSNLAGFGYASTYSNYYTIEQEYSVAAEPLIEYVAETLVNAPTVPRYVVVDGTYITTNQLELDGTGPTAPAHVIFGWMRDDAAFMLDFTTWPTLNTTEGQYLMELGLSENFTDMIVASGLFPIPSGANATWDLFNASTRVATDGQFRCLHQATAVAAAKNHIFSSVYTYEFHRSYLSYMPLPDTCVPPVTAEYPYGDPNLPYFNCHSGDLYYTFGTLGQVALPFRDWNDLVFSQIVVDAWSAFARTYNPNPSRAYLVARGYANTTAALMQGGLWEQVTPHAETPLCIFNVPLSNAPYLEQAQCQKLEP
ncbi:Alpha/Beta hydrolase protein [Melanogaster broomeanus]|nr:Alpha/Beta hydrolase protein [Melanogaster broomeanus]